MDKFRKNIKLLKQLSKCKKILRKNILKFADEELVLSICECVLNTLNGNIKLDHKIIKKLEKYKKHLRNLADVNLSLKKKKKILIQQGGFLNLLLPAALTVLTTLLQTSRE